MGDKETINILPFIDPRISTSPPRRTDLISLSCLSIDQFTPLTQSVNSIMRLPQCSFRIFSRRNNSVFHLIRLHLLYCLRCQYPFIFIHSSVINHRQEMNIIIQRSTQTTTQHRGMSAIGVYRSKMRILHFQWLRK